MKKISLLLAKLLFEPVQKVVLRYALSQVNYK